MALAFIDDSGSGGDSPYCVLAGYVASEEVWNEFDYHWRTVLDPHPQLEYFKMSEAESLKGQFTNLTIQDRDIRVGKFIDVILRMDLWEASVCIPSKHFNDVLYPWLPPSRANPYYSAFIGIATALSGFYRWLGMSEVVDFVFDEQDGMQTKATRQYSVFRAEYPEWRLGRVAFADENKVLPLQAADLIAWQTRRFMCSQEGTRKELKRLHSMRQPFRKIVKRHEIQEMADAILRNLPKLREIDGDSRVDALLSSIQRRNAREAAQKAKAV